MMFALVMAALSYFSQTASQSEPLLSPIPEEIALSTPAVPNSTPFVNPASSMPEVLSASIEPIATASPTISPTPSTTTISTKTPTPSPTIKPKTTTTSTTPSPTIVPTSEATASASPQDSPSDTPTPSPTNSPTPSPTNKPLTAAEIDSLFTEYAQKYNVDKDQLKRIAQCESGLNPKATNLYYGGLFQFSAGSWKGYRRQMGKRTDPDLRFDPEAAINTAAYLISTGRASAWPNCK